MARGRGESGHGLYQCRHAVGADALVERLDAMVDSRLSRYGFLGPVRQGNFGGCLEKGLQSPALFACAGKKWQTEDSLMAVANH